MQTFLDIIAKIGVVTFIIGFVAFIVFCFRQGFQVRPDPENKPRSDQGGQPTMFT